MDRNNLHQHIRTRPVHQLWHRTCIALLLLLSTSCDRPQETATVPMQEAPDAAKETEPTEQPPAKLNAAYQRIWLKEQSDPAELLNNLGMADYVFPQVDDPNSRYIKLDYLGEEIFTRTEEKAVVPVTDEVTLSRLIRDAASNYGVPIARIYAVIRAESAFKPEAISPAGAQGLMQLMPKTAIWLDVQDAFDPADNIDGGTRYLKMLYAQFDDWDLTHAAYNAGPGNVKKYGNRIPPFEETRSYVARINRYLDHYRQDRG